MDSARLIIPSDSKNGQKPRIVLMEALDILLQSEKVILGAEDKKFIEKLKHELRNFNDFKKCPDFDPDELFAVLKRYTPALNSYDIIFHLKREKSNDSFYVYGTSQNQVIDAITEDQYYMLVRRYQYFNEYKHGKSFNIHQINDLPSGIVLSKRSKIAWRRGAVAQGYAACVYPNKDNPNQWVIDMAPAFNGIVTEKDKEAMRDKWGVRYKDDECVYSQEKRGGNTGVVHKQLKALYHLEGIQPILGFGMAKGMRSHGLRSARLYIQSGNMNEPNINRNPEQLLCYWFTNLNELKPNVLGEYDQFFIKRCLPKEIAKKIATAIVSGLSKDHPLSSRYFNYYVKYLMMLNESYFKRYENLWERVKEDSVIKCELLVKTILYSLAIGSDNKGIPPLEETLYYLELNCNRTVEREVYWRTESQKVDAARKLRIEYLSGQKNKVINIAEKLIEHGKLEALKTLYKIIADNDEIAKYTDIADCRGNTPFMIAVKERQLDIIEYLVTQNPSINLDNETGRAAIKLALEKNRLDLATKLLAKLESLNKWKEIDKIHFNKHDDELSVMDSPRDDKNICAFKKLRRNRFFPAIQALTEIIYQSAGNGVAPMYTTLTRRG